jgi:hypothetical protein
MSEVILEGICVVVEACLQKAMEDPARAFVPRIMPAEDRANGAQYVKTAFAQTCECINIDYRKLESHQARPGVAIGI